ncbi:MAG: hypothetical protein M3N38_08885 [Pseudomonadota bacterium]|nr:hypothetical protein [Pseudomonadota bacterium]
MLRLLSAMVIGTAVLADTSLGSRLAQEQMVAAKDQSQIAPDDGPDLTQPPPAAPEDPEQSETVPLDEMSLGEVPLIEVVELTPESARKGMDAFALVRERYADSSIYQYENLEEFVEKTEEGKKFETDIKSFGFATIDEWNKVITTIGLAYSAITDSPTEDIEKQIAEIQADTSLAKDMKDRMVKSLSAMVPTPNNRKILEALAKDAEYGDKLKLLAEEE